MDLKEMRERKKELGINNGLIAELSGVQMEIVESILHGALKDAAFEDQPNKYLNQLNNEDPYEENLMAEENLISEEILISMEETLKPGGKAERFVPRTLKTENEDPGLADRVREVQLSYDEYGEYSPQKDEKGRPIKNPGEYTIEDYLAWPEDERIELIDGRIYYMLAPSYVHQVVAVEIYYAVRNYIREQGGNSLPGIAPIDVQLDCDDRTMVQPDVIIDCRSKKKNPMRIIGAPDFMLEVLSGSTKLKDTTIKKEKYAKAGCREYWMVDPKEETVEVCDFEGKRNSVKYSFDDLIPVNIYNGELKVDFSKIKETLEENFELKKISGAIS